MGFVVSSFPSERSRPRGPAFRPRAVPSRLALQGQAHSRHRVECQALRRKAGIEECVKAVIQLISEDSPLEGSAEGCLHQQIINFRAI
ncbi:hypothetical protein TH63_15845 [Rufibacter radiotolerans]|uniref:Uncharacterized protein n=1 Tax=Rufibacter radiotolerans TaxID=1379910 RepID=A0A0H4W8I1_9BACT|nr:hypothetical protein TH63_15845 [Rufibacter radiotolerans]